ncbi:hypothetical protein SNEBB_006826 [Seison nebaliae]|nr:hypothetical protein SNEBB_006826 [Seison nebaliae]
MIQSMNKAYLIITISGLTTCLVFVNAYVQKKQFYPMVVYLTKSSTSLAILYFDALILFLMFAKCCSLIFFGRLRAIEVEHLIERYWYAFTETCLAFAAFRDNFTVSFVTIFALLLFIKAFHWLAEDRVEMIERSPHIPLLFHCRLISLTLLLTVIDVYSIKKSYHLIAANQSSIQLVFGLEYAILFLITLSVAFKYSLHFLDSFLTSETKGLLLLYSDVIIGLFKLIFYSIFVLIIFKWHIFPIFIIRQLYQSIRGLRTSISDIIQSRRAIRYMNEYFPTVTDADLRSASVDTTCIICREEMTAGAKRLPCNHIFHVVCLRSWFQRQQTCPICRNNILTEPPNSRRVQENNIPQLPIRVTPPPGTRPSSTIRTTNPQATLLRSYVNATNNGNRPVNQFRNDINCENFIKLLRNSVENPTSSSQTSLTDTNGATSSSTTPSPMDSLLNSNTHIPFIDDCFMHPMMRHQYYNMPPAYYMGSPHPMYFPPNMFTQNTTTNPFPSNPSGILSSTTSSTSSSYNGQILREINRLETSIADLKQQITNSIVQQQGIDPN